ncbi:MAG: pseudouridine-5'-phosphate glycosidase [Alphaproteobacteria bacterium]|nr:pseudouridine-5'-phosphate glycosidase [Alphaproteobacteria bacterium]
MNKQFSAFLKFGTQAQRAIQNNVPIVALESTVISHGLPYPDNLEVTKKMMSAITEAGAVPAVIGLMDGFIHIGLNEDELELFSTRKDILKISRSDIAYCLSEKKLGATTVSATMLCAFYAGIRVFSTGGLGGVHRGAEETFDISADLTELSKTPVLVVCSGAKSILDVPKTLEYLETQGVPIIGYQTNYFPLFFTKESEYPLTGCLRSPEEIASFADINWKLGLAGMVVANPVPAVDSLEGDVVEEWIQIATMDADERGIKGKAVTPFILARVAELSAGKTMQTNKSLLVNNAILAGKVAVSLKVLNSNTLNM